MRYLYLLLRYGSILLLYFGLEWANATCAFDETSHSARCFSFADTEKLFSRAEEISNLEVECILAENDGNDQNTTTKTTTFSSFSFPNLNALSIHGCGEGTAEIQMPTSHTIRSLNLSKNEITNLKWQKFQASASDVVDLRQNPLSCEDCTNLWIWEHQKRSSSSKNSIWDLHYIVGLPRQILTDEEFRHCNFSHCPREEVQAYAVNGPLQIGDTVTLYCDVNGLNESYSNNFNDTNFKQFIWPLRNDFASIENSTISSTILNETWNSYRSQMSLQITSLTSMELGYVACICQHCTYRPAFDVLELRFDTNITVSLEEDERDSHLIVHGNPLEDLNITISRISDNETETSLLSTKKTSFFNDSLLIRFQQDHSHFFVRYYSLIVQECILCPPRLSTHIDGDYLIEICRIKTGDCAIAKGYLDHPIYESITKNDESNISSTDRSRHLLLITIFLILLIVGLLIALSKTHLKHRLLKKGWEIKRRRTSRNTDRTEETSIRLDDYSASSSLNYIAQHVPLIDKEFINIKEKIGKGAFGEVFSAEWIEKDLTKIVAIKMLHGIQLDSDLDKEAALLAKMDHPNIVRLYGISRWDTNIALVMEMMNLGDLKNYVRQRMPRCDNYSQFPAPLLTTELLNIAGQIAAGLCYLNSQQIVHRDLAARNCLVQGETDLKVCNAAFRKPIAVKISDFGMSRRLYSDGEYYKMQNGKTVLPVRWLPPECLSSGKFTIQSDMWSFGMTLFELFSYGDVPFGDLSNNEVLTAVMSGMKPQLPSSFPEPINNLISQCWRNSPEERITAAEALNRLQIIQ